MDVGTKTIGIDKGTDTHTITVIDGFNGHCFEIESFILFFVFWRNGC